MRIIIKQHIRKIGLSALLLGLMVGIILLTNYLTKPSRERGIRTAITQVLKTYGDGDTQLGDKVYIPSTGFSYTQVFETRTKGSGPGLVFLVCITGSQGPYPAIILYDKKTGTHFIGLAGIDGTQPEPELWGIRPTILSSWLLRIQKIADSYGEIK